MKPHSQIPYSDVQRQAAAEWFVTIHADEGPSSEDLQAWLRWMDQDEGNRLAFEAIVEAWQGTPGSAGLIMPSAEELRADDYEGDQPVTAWLASQVVAEPAHEQPSEQTAHAYRWQWLVAASVLIVMLGIFAMNRSLTLHGSQADAFATRSGEQMELTLADGSRVWLGPKSDLQVDFTGSQRTIRLLNGEAFFSVRKDRKRPFVVRSVGGDITAVGTAFNVRALSDRVTVAVSEGVVTVASKHQLIAAQSAAVRVSSGQQVSFAAEQSVEPMAIVQSATLGERARWRDGVLVYRNEPLRDVVMDVARYSERELHIAGDDIGQLRYSGVVYEGAIDEWLAALPESFPVKVVIEGNRETILAR